MNKILLISFVCFIIISCGTKKFGNIPNGKNPDIMARYYEGGYNFFNAVSHNENKKFLENSTNESFDAFTKRHCIEKGFKNVSGYTIDELTKRTNTTLFDLSVEQRTFKEVQIWCTN